MTSIQIPKVGDFYYHYKHDFNKNIQNYAYKIIGIALHSEREELLVAYLPLYFPNHIFDYKADFYVRPLNMFMENVDNQKYSGPRFRLITDHNIIEELKKL
jgi:hypothetical protein